MQSKSSEPSANRWRARERERERARPQTRAVEKVARASHGFRGPRFDRAIPAGGYQWHYLDGVSDDGATAIVIIALLGNPFSPAYARARAGARLPASPLTFCSMNVALYARGKSAWALQERPVRAHDRGAANLTVGASTMAWDGDRLVVDIDERTTPLRRPVRGRVVVHPEAQTGLELDIDTKGDHKWWPVAPMARIEVDFPTPGVRFTGHGYHDANAGEGPLDTAFESWSWARARTSESALISYDVATVSGATSSLAFEVGRNGDVRDLDGVWSTPLPETTWGLARTARVDEGRSARVVRPLEDGPFYARALVETRLGGHTVVAVHEALAAHRLRQAWVRALTAFRMRTVSR